MEIDGNMFTSPLFPCFKILIGIDDLPLLDQSNKEASASNGGTLSVGNKKLVLTLKFGRSKRRDQVLRTYPIFATFLSVKFIFGRVFDQFRLW